MLQGLYSPQEKRTVSHGDHQMFRDPPQLLHDLVDIRLCPLIEKWIVYMIGVVQPFPVGLYSGGQGCPVKPEDGNGAC